MGKNVWLLLIINGIIVADSSQKVIDPSTVITPREQSVQLVDQAENNPLRGSCKHFCSLKVTNLNAQCATVCNLEVAGSETINGNLSVGGNTTVNNLAVNGTFSGGGASGLLCQPGPLNIGTSNATTLNLVTSGCTNAQVTIDPTGNVTIPNGNLTVPHVIELGDPMNVFEVSTHNFFVSDTTGLLSVTGSNNIGIGASVNTGLTTANNTVAIGNNAQAPSESAIAIGDATTASNIAALVLGVASTASGTASIAIGNGATSSNSDTIAIGTTAQSTGQNAITLGVGAKANNSNSVAIGVNAIASVDSGIVLGDPTAAAVAVGIGTSTPGAKLHAISANASNIPVTILDAGTGSTAANSAPQFLNLTNPGGGTALQLNGSNQLILAAPSSRRFKENFRSIKELIETIYSLNPLIFDYTKENGGAQNQFGFVAEEVAPFLPSIINYERDGVTPRSINYECFHALAIAAIQDQKKKIDTQATEISELRAVISNLLIAFKLLEEKTQREANR